MNSTLGTLHDGLRVALLVLDVERRPKAAAAAGHAYLADLVLFWPMMAMKTLYLPRGRAGRLVQACTRRAA